MKKAIIFAIIAAIGYVGFSYYKRTRSEFELQRDVRGLLTAVPWDARGLDASQVRVLEDLLLGHGFTLNPQSIRLTTKHCSGRDRPVSQIGNQNKLVEHVLLYVYERPTVLLPFKTEMWQQMEKKIVQIPNSAPKMGPGGFSY